MRTVNEVSKLTGVSIRTLHYYDTIELLKPSATTESGYRLYDDMALERLQHIMLFRELEFPLKEIKRILDCSDFDRNKALEQQIELLTLKKERLENIIDFARGIKLIGVKELNFKAFDTTKIDDYAEQVKAKWGNTEAYKEFEKKTEGLSEKQKNDMGNDMMKLFVEFGVMKDKEASCSEVQHQVERLQGFITEHYYTCTNEILAGLGKMYACSEEFKENIDNAGGQGTAAFVAEAISIYCK